jgi:hypothetical protein
MAAFARDALLAAALYRLCRKSRMCVVVEGAQALFDKPE